MGSIKGPTTSKIGVIMQASRAGKSLMPLRQNSLLVDNSMSKTGPNINGCSENRQLSLVLGQAHTASRPAKVDVSLMGPSLDGAGELDANLHGPSNYLKASPMLSNQDEDMLNIYSTHEASHGNNEVSMDY
ncbi:hypothetical protein TanjilG_08702 [Lupinus angustifolius]|uniref:Uncharacterized protein n=1 Tax=Lupinus angustifolius TaxID=3871 RepID=A0A4P1QX00_LUPAN|nr:hypothetical protein TanjilG_08702 [Lupinus angustifolius]